MFLSISIFNFRQFKDLVDLFETSANPRKSEALIKSEDDDRGTFSEADEKSLNVSVGFFCLNFFFLSCISMNRTKFMHFLYYSMLTF